MYEIFLKFHFFLAIVAVVALLKHLLLFGMHRAALPIAAILLWGVNAGLRLGQMAYHNIGGLRDGGVATIEHFYGGVNKSFVTAMKIHVSLRHGTKIRPGEYYYLSVRGMGFRRGWQAHPFVVSWWDDSINASSLDFLVEPKAGITADLMAKNSIRSVTLDGPYGKDLQLQEYENVILVARGIGIAGVLPYVRHMIYRRSSTSKDLEEYRRGLITRKIDLYWDMEDNNQQDWLEGWIRALKDRDAEKVCVIPRQSNMILKACSSS
jgi:predicted ferric reductase